MSTDLQPLLVPGRGADAAAAQPRASTGTSTAASSGTCSRTGCPSASTASRGVALRDRADGRPAHRPGDLGQRARAARRRRADAGRGDPAARAAAHAPTCCSAMCRRTPPSCSAPRAAGAASAMKMAVSTCSPGRSRCSTRSGCSSGCCRTRAAVRLAGAILWCAVVGLRRGRRGTHWTELTQNVTRPRAARRRTCC